MHTIIELSLCIMCAVNGIFIHFPYTTLCLVECAATPPPRRVNNRANFKLFKRAFRDTSNGHIRARIDRWSSRVKINFSNKKKFVYHNKLHVCTVRVVFPMCFCNKFCIRACTQATQQMSISAVKSFFFLFFAYAFATAEFNVLRCVTNW